MNNPTTLAVRAIAVTFARQLLLPIIIAAAVVIVLLWVGLIILTAQVSSWWLLALVLLVPATFMTILVASLLWFLLKKLTPVMSERQTTAATRFVERTSSYAEVVGMSRFVLAFHIIRRAVQKKSTSYFDELLSHSSELREDFTTVRDEFAKTPRKVVRNIEDSE